MKQLLKGNSSKEQRHLLELLTDICKDSIKDRILLDDEFFRNLNEKLNSFCSRSGYANYLAECQGLSKDGQIILSIGEISGAVVIVTDKMITTRPDNECPIKERS